jgi:ABC-2 type transport system ATP-binding protein
MQALTLTNLTKTYRVGGKPPFTALDGVSFAVETGKIHGLLGPNGAGKSTLINIVSGVTLPTSGTATVFDVDVAAEPERAKRLIGVVPQELVTEMPFTVEEVLHYFSGMYGVPRAERKDRIGAVLEDLSLTDKRNEKARTLSGGMKRRLMIAKAVLHRPKLLILDEPTAGVDVALRQKTWELVRRINKEGTTILFTTHYLEEAEELCDRITLINKGRLITEGTLDDLRTAHAGRVIQFELYESAPNHLPGVRQVGDRYEYPIEDLTQDMAKLAAQYGKNLKDIKSEGASLEQIFLALTSKTA